MTAVYSIVRFALAERSLGLRGIQLGDGRPDFRHPGFDVVFVADKVPVGSDPLLDPPRWALSVTATGRFRIRA